MKAFLALSVFIIFITVSCKFKSAEHAGAVALPTGDSTFLALKDTAQAHLQTFIDSLKINGSNTAEYRFAVKSDFVENGHHEHMWSDILKYDSGKFKGLFIDSAFVIKNIKTGDEVSISRADIEDWFIYNKITDKTIGYYSEKYLKGKEAK